MNIAGEDGLRSLVPVGRLVDSPTEESFGSGDIDIGDTHCGHGGHLVNRSEIGIKIISGVSVVDTGESGGSIVVFKVEKEQATAMSSHLVEIAALGVIAFTCSDEDDAVVDSDHSADGEGQLLAIDIAGLIFP